MNVAREMIAAELLRLRKKWTLIAWAFVLTSGAVLAFFGYDAVAHATSPLNNGPAGGTKNFETGMQVLGGQVGLLAAVLIGAEAGAGDVASGVFRDLVVTGRSRVALFLVRIPGALALLVPLMALGFAIAAGATFAFAGGLPTPSASLVADYGLWMLMTSAVVLVVAVGLASLTGSRPVTLTVLIGWIMVAGPLLMHATGLGSARDAVLDSALLHFQPGTQQFGIEVAMSTTAGIVVLAAYASVATALGAWRTRTRDA